MSIKICDNKQATIGYLPKFLLFLICLTKDFMFVPARILFVKPIRFKSV